MSRLKQNDQMIFNQKLDSLIIEYKKLRRGQELVNTNELIKKYDLYRNHKLITYKAFSNILNKKNIISQFKWKSKIVERYYLYLSNKNVNREDAVKIIACKLNLQVNVINNRLRNLGYGNKRIINKKLLNIIQDINNDLSFELIMDKHDINKTVLKQIAKKYNINIDKLLENKNVKYTYRNLTDVNIFNAHLIGLIWADGSISMNRQVDIKLCVDDLNYIKKIHNSLFKDNKKSKLTITDNSNQKNRKSNKNMVTLCISRKSYVDYLREQGLTQNKEKNEIKLPIFIYKSSNEIFLSFLKGFFEGDGHITSSTKKPSLGFSVTKELGEDIKKELFKRFQIKSNMVKDKSIYRLSIGGVAPIFYLLIHMYKILPDIYMPRKFEKAQEIWKIFLPNYLVNIMPLLNKNDLLNDKLSNNALMLLSQMFSIETKIIYIQNTTTKEEFLKLYPAIKPSLLNRVINGDRQSTNNWILVEKPNQRYILSINKKFMEQIIHLENKESNIKYSGKLIDFLNKYYFGFEDIKKLLNGLIKSYRNWYINYNLTDKKVIDNNFRNSLQKNSYFYQNKISLINKETDEIFNGKEIDFMIKYHIPPRYLKRVINKTRNQVRGWYLFNEYFI